MPTSSVDRLIPGCTATFQRVLSSLRDLLRTQYVARTGNWRARARLGAIAQRPPSVAAALDAVARRWPDAHSDSPEDPVFVLAAGGRTGSRGGQRGLMTSGQIVIWGEPYCHGQIVQGLAQQVLAF